MDRYKVSGAKNDRFDARVLANVLRTDLTTLKPILTRDRETLIRTQSRLVNKLTCCLKTYYPLVLDLFGDLQSAHASQSKSRRHLCPSPHASLASVMLIRFWIRNRWSPRDRLLYTGVALIGFALLATTGFWGGDLAYRYGAGVQAKAPNAPAVISAPKLRQEKQAGRHFLP